MSDYTLFKPLIDKLTSKLQIPLQEPHSDTTLSFYTNSLKFYGESSVKDKIVYILLYIDCNNISQINRLLSNERSNRPALAFCKEVLKCVYILCDPFDIDEHVEKLQMSLFDKTDDFINHIDIEDSKRYVRFIVELLWLMLNIRITFLNGNIVERKLTSIIQSYQAQTKFSTARSLFEIRSTDYFIPSEIFKLLIA